MILTFEVTRLPESCSFELATLLKFSEETVKMGKPFDVTQGFERA